MTPEFSRPVSLDRIAASGTVRKIAAEEEERRALAKRFGIVSIESLAADVVLRRTRKGDVGFSAHFSARVEQECVVTLEPVTSEIDEEVTLLFRPVGEEKLLEKTVVIPTDEDFEPFAGDSLDIGEAIAVELALSLDPFPRSPEADSETGSGGIGDASPDTTDSPFRKLEAGTETR